MKRFFFALAAIAVQAAGSAIAADLPIKAPIYAPPAPVIYSWWTGCYLGGNVGGAWSRTGYSYNNAVLVEDFGFKPISLIGGGQFGCQYQWTNLVFGAEGTWSKTHLQENQTSVLFLPPEQRSFNIDQIATVTGRIGYTWDRTMLYFKGGWAGARVRTSGVNFGVLSEVSNWGSGWTVGTGLEYSPWQGIILGIEADYYRVTFDASVTDAAGRLVQLSNGHADIFAVVARASYLFGPRLAPY